MTCHFCQSKMDYAPGIGYFYVKKECDPILWDGRQEEKQGGAWCQICGVDIPIQPPDMCQSCLDILNQPQCSCNATASGRVGHRNWCEQLKSAVKRKTT